MKLEEKFTDAFKSGKSDIKNAEIIADEFAIEFAEWVSYRYKFLENKGWFGTSFQLEMGIFKTSEELLEEFKKEKGL